MPTLQVGDYTHKTCKPESDPSTCSRGFGAWPSEAACCAKGAAFPGGCGKRPAECWVVDSYSLKACFRDDRRCYQGFDVWGTEAECCAAAFKGPGGCAKLPAGDKDCWIGASYYPARTCRATRVACDKRGKTWSSEEACCRPGAAFTQGCSAAPAAPCWVLDSYNPAKCRLETEPAKCNKGWHVFASEDACCAPGGAFVQGCAKQPAPAKARGKP